MVRAVVGEKADGGHGRVGRDCLKRVTTLTSVTTLGCATVLTDVTVLTYVTVLKRRTDLGTTVVRAVIGEKAHGRHGRVGRDCLNGYDCLKLTVLGGVTGL